jgi:hypothetical protein
MQEPEFPREYQGQYLGRIGNVFTSSQVQDCIDLGEGAGDDKIAGGDGDDVILADVSSSQSF